MIIKNLGGHYLVTAKWLPLNGYPHMGGLFREKAIFRALQACSTSKRHCEERSNLAKRLIAAGDNLRTLQIIVKTMSSL